LTAIAEGFEKPIKVNLTILRKERAHFARVCVKVNLKQPLKGTVVVNGECYYASYEGLNVICSLCGVFGHLAGACPKRSPGPVVQVTSTESGASPSGGDQPSDGFTEVRILSRRGPVQGKGMTFAARGSAEKRSGKSVEREKRSGTELMEISNSFGGLEAVVEEQGMLVPDSSGEENKENEGDGAALTSVVRLGGPDGKLVEGKGRLGGITDRRAGHYKPMKGRGLKGKGGRNRIATRGLVFGTIRGEQTEVSPRKRLRVKHENVGRPGGAFSNGSSRNLGNAQLPVGNQRDGEEVRSPASGSASMDLGPKEGACSHSISSGGN